MKKILSIIVIVLVTLSCSKENTKSVCYLATGSISDVNLDYLSESGEMMSISISPQSAQDEWKYSFAADQGDIVYISGYYNDINSALKLMILVDGKVYKQASNEADTINYLTVSGTIVYDN